jgi:TRAP-type C4-dicarboxylate transport system permease large subunit
MLSILVVLILITYVPGVVTWIPNLVMGASR